jgi:hypothetical protein
MKIHRNYRYVFAILFLKGPNFGNFAYLEGILNFFSIDFDAVTSLKDTGDSGMYTITVAGKNQIKVI